MKNEVRLVDMDDLKKYIKDYVDIGDVYYTKCFEKSLDEVCEEYYKEVIGDITTGQTVWVITGSDYSGYKIRECNVTKMQIKKRRTFTVNDGWYNGTFTKNSVGKKVFLTKEEAEEKLKQIGGKLNFIRREI